MSRRKKPEARCQSCQMRFEFCLCNDIEKLRQEIQCQTRVVVLMHYREYWGTTNTARLARLILPKSELIIRGKPDSKTEAEKLFCPGYDSLLLYPSDDSVELSSEYLEHFKNPINLIVPDGSWRQASKVPKREALLKDIPRVRIPNTQPSRYQLRREPKAGGLATFEAISRALGLIEGYELQAKLDSIFDEMVRRTLKSRGTVASPR